MIKLEERKSSFANSYKVITDKEYFEIFFAGNLDLYWVYHPNTDDVSIKTFNITTENEFLYNEFKTLYNNIKNNDPFGNGKIDNHFINCNPYNNGKIVWYSDDAEIEKASSIVIEEDDEKYKITFNKAKEYDSMFDTYSIRFRNSGSRYNPYNFAFMKMYKDMEEYFSKEKTYIKK